MLLLFQSSHSHYNLPSSTVDRTHSTMISPSKDPPRTGSATSKSLTAWIRLNSRNSHKAISQTNTASKNELSIVLLTSRRSLGMSCLKVPAVTLRRRPTHAFASQRRNWSRSYWNANIFIERLYEAPSVAHGSSPTSKSSKLPTKTGSLLCSRQMNARNTLERANRLYRCCNCCCFAHCPGLDVLVLI